MASASSMVAKESVAFGRYTPAFGGGGGGAGNADGGGEGAGNWCASSKATGGAFGEVGAAQTML